MFGFGMVAVVNPCGFAMLPAYVGFFVGAEDTASPLGVMVRAVPRRDAALERLAQQHNGRLVVIGVNMWDDREAAAAMMKKLGVTYRSGFDADSTVVQAYDISVVPSTLLFITADGCMAARATGKPSPAELNDMLSTHLQIPPGRDVAPATTVATTLTPPR